MYILIRSTKIYAVLTCNVEILLLSHFLLFSFGFYTVFKSSEIFFYVGNLGFSLLFLSM